MEYRGRGLKYSLRKRGGGMVFGPIYRPLHGAPQQQFATTQSFRKGSLYLNGQGKTPVVPAQKWIVNLNTHNPISTSIWVSLHILQKIWKSQMVGAERYKNITNCLKKLQMTRKVWQRTRLQQSSRPRFESVMGEAVHHLGGVSVFQIFLACLWTKRHRKQSGNTIFQSLVEGGGGVLWDKLAHRGCGNSNTLWIWWNMTDYTLPSITHIWVILSNLFKHFTMKMT